MTNFGTIREIFNSKLKNEIRLLTDSTLQSQKQQQSNNENNDFQLLSMTISNSEQFSFISSNKGHVFQIQIPFENLQNQNNNKAITYYHYYNCAVTNLRITYDDKYLITSSKNGTLGIWYIKINNPPENSLSVNVNAANTTTTVTTIKSISIDQNLLKSTDILVPHQFLIERLTTINDLELRIKQQNIEINKQINDKNQRNENEIYEIRKKYENIIETYGERLKQLQIQKVNELKLKTNEIQQIKLQHSEFIKVLNENYEKKFNEEKQKIKFYENIECKLQDEYNKKLENLTNYLQNTIESLEFDFNMHIKELQNLITDLLKELNIKNLEYQKLLKKIDLDNDYLLQQLKIDYEKKLQNEKIKLQEKNNEFELIQIKFNEISNNYNQLLEKNQLILEELNINDKKNENLNKRIQNLEMYEIKLLMKKISNLENELYEKDLIINMKEKQIEFIKEIQEYHNELEKCQISSDDNENNNNNNDNGNDNQNVENENHNIPISENNLHFHQRQPMKKLSKKFYGNDTSNHIQKNDDFLKHNDDINYNEQNFKNYKKNLLKTLEKRKILELESQLSNILCDIHKLLQNSNNNLFTFSNIKDHIKKLHNKYIKTYTNIKLIQDSLDIEKVNDEFLRQRLYLENKIIIERNQKELDRKHYELIINKLIKEKCQLIQELNEFKKKIRN